ncbi:MAG: NB-ARC domain-containing protein [Ktedonobacteraceae bacterium]
MKYIFSEVFNTALRQCLRAKGYYEKDLAKATGLNAKVFSRKLNNSGNAHLTVEDVKRIITAIVQLEVITSQNEIVSLLNLAQLDASIFSEEEWHEAPLNGLLRSNSMLSTQPEPSDIPIHSIYPLAHSDYGLSRHLQHNLLAPLTRLIGREKAVEEVRQLVEQDDVRLVTLVGPGGSGKTRLALQVANELLEKFPQGVWFVSLAPVHNAALVPQSIMQALNIMSSPVMTAMENLAKYLQHKQLLLILDNFEQVVEAAAIVDELLISVLGLKVLVTSRKSLRLSGEHEYGVLPLDIPDAKAGSEVAKLASYSAIQLFVERAQAIVHDFTLANENASTIAQICARVDGLPLALELAAARMKILSPPQLLEQVSKARLPVLSRKIRNLPERQQTLRDTITWSYDLLSSTEQRWFARLGIFSGGWSLEAIEAMMQFFRALPSDHVRKDESVSTSALDLLDYLMDNSLLVKLTSDGQVHYTLLETLCEYALEQLVAHEEHELLCDWHASYYLSLAEVAEMGLRGAEQRNWEARLLAEQDNFRAALEWSCQRAKNEPETGLLAAETALRLAAALRPHWEWQGYYNEGRRWLEAALALPIEQEMGNTALAAHAKALSYTACLACLQNEQERAVLLANDSIAFWQQLNNAAGLATALLHRGWAAQAMFDNELAKHLYKRGMDLLSSNGNIWLRGQLLLYLCSATGFTNDFEQMHSYFVQSKALFEQIGDNLAIADLLKDRGGMSILEGHYDEAIAYILQSIPVSYELGYKQFIATGMGSLAFAVGARGEPDPISASVQSAQLWGAADSIQSAIGTSPWLHNFPYALALFSQIYSRIDRASWKMAWRTGKSLTTEQAVVLCLSIPCKQYEELGNARQDVDLPTRETPSA